MISERLKDLRKQLKFSRTEFGKKLGVTNSVITNIELNRVPPKDIFIEHVCDIFDVNKEWLLSGTDEMFNPSTSENKSSEELLNLFKRLKPEFQEYVLQQMDRLLKLQNDLDNSKRE